jgi:hemoglobin
VNELAAAEAIEPVGMATSGRGIDGGAEPVRADRGVNAIAMVVDRFSDQIVKNPKLNVNPALKEWNGTGQLPGLKFMRTLWLCQTAGGPFQYTGKDMGEAHEDLHLTSEEFDEVGAEIAAALDHFKVPEREKQEVLAAIVAKKEEVINPSR